MIRLYFDGACEPINPGGTASYGFVVFQDDKEIYSESKIVAEGKDASNNVAEYNGLLNALRWLYKNKFNQEKIECIGDSKLVVCQMNGQYRINKGIYVPWAYKCKDAVKYFNSISFKWVSRAENIADEVSKKALKDRGVKFRIQPE